ncbi:MAG TPA: N-acetylmuramoyl-L-alanine amidase [Streptosporangiaceae bacterium]
MSVARCREINARLRALGFTVHEWPGWESRGNGQTSAYEGGIVHHTASPYGSAYLSLVDGRADLAGPLCNYAGNADGSFTVIAAHPANHAGASGGRSMGPLPVTATFNRRVMGLEIVYPGTAPMTDAQRRSATAWSRVVTDVLGNGDIERARAHAETSVTGKWDPGYAPGKTIDMRQFRADAARALTQGVAATMNPALYKQQYDIAYGANSKTGEHQLFEITDGAFRRAGTAVNSLAAVNAKLDALGVAVAQIRNRVDSFDPDNDGLVSTESTAAQANWAEVVAAAERGSQQGASAAILARLDALEQALQADDTEQAAAGARRVLAEIRDALPPREDVTA